ncbi:MAG TPA: response regulator transcription factor [Chitinophagaceae bacterium]|jgi:DNA-binding NarL/FixJ family response regulator|nr:response regulator transcription factor [Chitinophagaceae bacterium]HPH30292.1 response regulator transcription factor [Chitinophagaceae bacterium]HPN57642.1 response regulator transcription factor [Chitinophagaceae bacterium]
MGKITILLVDDHKLIRDSWSFILNSDSRFQVIGETSNADEAVEIARTKKPDIVLMDINMTPVNGFEATKLVRKFSPGSKIIGISMHSMPAYARRMLQIGAMGYVTKNSSKDELINSIVEVYGGKKYICEEVKNILAQQELEDEGGTPDMNVLSRRELDIVQLIKEGLSSKEIAIRLDISLKTVEVHRYNILKKLSLKNTAALVNFINVHGL